MTDLCTIKQSIVTAIGQAQDLALMEMTERRQWLESLQSDLRWILDTQVNPMIEGRAPCLLPPQISVESEEALDNHPRVRAVTKEKAA